MSKITMDNFAVMSVQYVHYSLEYYLDSMVKNGLKHVDLWGGIPHYCRLDYPFAEDAKKKIGSIRAMMEERGLDVSVYTPETLAYPYSFSHPEEEVRKRTVDYFNMAMDDALLFGTNKVFLNSGCGLLDLPREESFARLVDTYKKIAAIAEQKGIELVLEQLQPYESNLVLNLQDIKRVLDEVDSPAMYICVDVVAMAVAGEELKDYFEVPVSVAVGTRKESLREFPALLYEAMSATSYYFGHSGDPVVFYSRQCETDVGRILRTFKIKKNVEVTDNGKIII